MTILTKIMRILAGIMYKKGVLIFGTIWYLECKLEEEKRIFLYKKHTN
jgi:hypothetical protein